MRCTACEKNEAHSAVICDSCRTHYAAIREGHYAERVVAVGELNLAVRSWVAVGAPAEKQKRRDEKVPKAKGPGPSWMKLMPGKVAEVPAAPVEEEAPPPPPDWKNRVFPVPDADDAPVSAPAAEPVQEASDGMSYGAETEFSYGTGHLDEQQVLDLEASAPAIEEPAPIELTPVVHEVSAAQAGHEVSAAQAGHEVSAAQAGHEVSAAQAEPEAPAAEVEAEPIGLTLESSVPQAVEPVAPEVEEPPAPAPELSSFFESLAAPEAPAATPVHEVSAASAEPVEAPAPIQADLANFFDSLTAPAQPAEAVPAPEPEAPAAPAVDLSSFFDSLTAPAAPAPEPVVEAAPEAPAALSNFFDSLSAPAPVEAAAPEPAPAAPVEAAPELSSFFESLSAPAPQAEPAPTASEPVVESPIAGFFESLATPAPTTEAAPAFEIAVPPTAAAPEASAEKKPFSIELDLPMSPTSAQPGASPQRQSGAMKPPTHGQPFAIDLGGGEAKPQPKKSNTAELKRQHSTAGAGFDLVSEDDEDAGAGSLFEGISFGGSAQDDDDDERTIEL